MKKLLTILFLFLSSFVYSQYDDNNPPETVIYSDTLYCYGSCVDECIDVKVYVELNEWNDFGGGYIHFNTNPDSSSIKSCKNMDIKKWNCSDAQIYIEPHNNEWNIKSIYINEDGIFIMHKHSLFKKHRFVYHNNK